jgi:hypothetical protein
MGGETFYPFMVEIFHTEKNRERRIRKNPICFS